MLAVIRDEEHLLLLITSWLRAGSSFVSPGLSVRLPASPARTDYTCRPGAGGQQGSGGGKAERTAAHTLRAARGRPRGDVRAGPGRGGSDPSSRAPGKGTAGR